MNINSREQIKLQKSHEPRNIHSYLLISVNIQVGCLTNDVIHNFITSLFLPDSLLSLLKARLISLRKKGGINKYQGGLRVQSPSTNFLIMSNIRIIILVYCDKTNNKFKERQIGWAGRIIMGDYESRTEGQCYFMIF